MAPRLTHKNIAILGLVQVGVVVGGVLAAGATYKWCSEFNMSIRDETRLATEYGFLVLAVPLLWITTAMVVQSRDDTGDAPEALTVLTGLVVLLLLLLLAFRVAAFPWIQLFSSSGLSP